MAKETDRRRKRKRETERERGVGGRDTRKSLLPAITRSSHCVVCTNTRQRFSAVQSSPLSLNKRFHREPTRIATEWRELKKKEKRERERENVQKSEAHTGIGSGLICTRKSEFGIRVSFHGFRTPCSKVKKGFRRMKML